MRWYLPNMRPAKAQTSLRMHAISPEPSLPKVRVAFSHITCEQLMIRQAPACAQSRQSLRCQKYGRLLASLDPYLPHMRAAKDQTSLCMHAVQSTAQAKRGNAFSPNIDSISDPKLYYWVRDSIYTAMLQE